MLPCPPRPWTRPNTERRALVAAVAEVLADPRPDIPHEEVRAEMLRDLEKLRQRLEALPAA
jgi:hypothetical protein